MANVVDPNSWRMVPTSDSHPSRIARSEAVDGPLAPGAANSTLKLLAGALQRTFNAPQDRVVWRLRGPGDAQQFRIDPSHDSTSERRADPAAEGATPDGSTSWLVLVQTPRDVANENGSPEVREALEQDGRLLLVICDDDEASTPSFNQRTLAEHVADRLHFRCWEPLTHESEDELAGVLARVKGSDRSSVLYFDASDKIRPPRFIPERDGSRRLDEGGRSYRELAATKLRALQAADERVVFFCTDATPHPEVARYRGETAAALIEHCQSLVTDGRRPFLFLSLEEARSNLPLLHESLAVPGSTMTIVIESRGGDKVPARSSQLAAFRAPHVNLLAPKDGLELGQMFDWCVSQAEPTIVWLSETFEPPVFWPLGEPIARARAERLGTGADVAIVAWGAMNAAAAVAAEQLANLGIHATVVNARFAQPFDVTGCARICAESSYTVLVDDSDAGGFAALAGEQLVRQGMAPLMTIVSPDAIVASGQRQEPYMLAEAIVDRCRWLNERIADAPSERIAAASVTVTARPAAACAAPPSILERASVIQAEVLATPLSADARRWARAYEEVGPRDLYLWQWCAHGVEITMLPSVSEQFRAHVSDTKVLSIILCVLLDDVADEHGDGQLLETLLGLTFSDGGESLRSLQGTQARHAEITRSLWAEYWQRVSRYPRFAEFEPVLRYDLQQFQNTMRYSYLVNEHPFLLNVAEHDLYTSHNMMIISFATLDLMCSPGFPRGEVGAIRELAWHAQCMGRYGNLLSTWRRELANCDFTSGVFARAMAQGHLTYEELVGQEPERIATAIQDHGHEAYFYDRWLEHRRQSHDCSRRVKSLDLRGVLNGHDRFFAMHLGSEGLI